jgi:hypothetical protein
MKSNYNIRKQQGAALLVALSFLVVITLISLTAMRSSTTELRLASNNEERASAEQVAQSAVDSAISNPTNLIVSGVVGKTNKTISLSVSDVAEFVDATILVTEGQTANPPRGLGVSADKFQGTIFHVDGSYNGVGSGRGQSFIGQGVVLLSPK